MPEYTMSKVNEWKLRNKIEELFKAIIQIVDDECPNTITLNQWLLATSNIVQKSIQIMIEAQLEATKGSIITIEEYGKNKLKENL